MSNAVKQDALLVLTVGHLSEYEVLGVYRALHDFDAIKLRDEWMEEAAAQDRANVHPDEFVEWLVKHEHIRAEKANDFFMGSYDFDDMEVFDGF